MQDARSRNNYAKVLCLHIGTYIWNFTKVRDRDMAMATQCGVVM